MTLYTRLRRRERYLEEQTAPLSSVLGATASDALVYSPALSLERIFELQNAEKGEPVGIGSPEMGDIERAPPSSRLVPPDEAREKVKQAGVNLTVPDGGIREQALDILIRRQVEDRRRKDALNRAPGGFWAGAARFGVALAASAVDPINVAASFIPAVGPARYTMMLAKAGGGFGRAGVRAGVGFAEGSIGAAIVEPLVYGAARYEQADYDLTDSLLNIAFGGVLGGGLHMGAGAIGDALARAARGGEQLPRLLEEAGPDVREAALRTAVGQAVEGRKVNVSPLIDEFGRDVFDPNIAMREATPPEAKPFNLGEMHGSRYYDYTRLSAGDKRMLRKVVDELETTDSGTRIFIERDGQGGTPDVVGIKATTPEWFQQINRDAATANKARARALDRNRRAGRDVVPVPEGQPILTRADVRRVADKVAAHKPLGKREAEIAENIVGIAREYRERDVRHMLETRAAREEERRASDDAIAAREAAEFEADMADMLASKEADAAIKEAPADAAAIVSDEMQRIYEEMNYLANALDDNDLPARELAPFDELNETAEAYGRAVKAAASCGLRRGNA